MTQKLTRSKPADTLLTELRGLIETARQHIAQTANATLTMLYWHVGQRIRREVLQDQRAGYGEEIVSTLSAKLVKEYGRGFAEKSLRRMVQFAEVFPDESIVVTLSRQLSWSHFVEILPLKQPLEREFYAEMCRIERWSVRILRERIGSQLYLRTAISKQPEAVVEAEINHLREGGQITPELVFRDPYMLDFLGLPQNYSKRDLEGAILREMERFLLELGAGFTFVARQKRISVGADVRTINYHLKKVFADSELQEDAVIRNFRITAGDGKSYDTMHYNLAAIIAAGYKVNSERAVQFCKWATQDVRVSISKINSEMHGGKEANVCGTTTAVTPNEGLAW